MREERLEGDGEKETESERERRERERGSGRSGRVIQESLATTVGLKDWRKKYVVNSECQAEDECAGTSVIGDTERRIYARLVIGM